ncbi:MAG: SAM-dependent DNA methyltransferase [Planctomycetes bacterium]|nr:SAM-dependent DNA methyltransferase [Planctomycetota bacterium]MCC7170071.1 SAM-dependent DNA methyltransferase [Planctomycetota bacterium]
MDTTAELTEATRAYMERVPIERRKQLGQFFTPRSIRERLLAGLELPPRARILDPACGTGEFLLSARERFPDAQSMGLEIDPELAQIARTNVPEAEIRIGDALRLPHAGEFDAVIGNPPYFEIKASAVPEDLRSVVAGRPNVFALFVKYGLDRLVDGGVLAFVLPPSMNNGAYFKALRDDIAARGRILGLELLDARDLFDGASQATMLLRVRKGTAGPERHVFRRGPFTLFVADPAELERGFEGAVTLADLDYGVRTGSVVWNEARADLTTEPRGAVRLIWSHDIGEDGRVRFVDKLGKPGFVKGRVPLLGPAIVVNRITGVGARARLRVAVVPPGVPFLAENHVNVVLPRSGTSHDRVSAVATALRSPHALAAARRLTGNTQISATELKHLIPLARADLESSPAPAPAVYGQWA